MHPTWSKETNENMQRTGLYLTRPDARCACAPHTEENGQIARNRGALNTHYRKDCAQIMAGRTLCGGGLPEAGKKEEWKCQRHLSARQVQIYEF
jgi:hypothetical protein